MSTLEPQTSAKARLHTTKGPIDVELWAKETPITSRTFLTNVLNQKFNGWLFNRILKDFIVQIDGSINQELFEDEFSTRLRFSKRGYLGSVNLGPRNSNTGKFFITLKDTPELNKKNTIFGKVVGDSIFSVIKISESETSEDDETPLYPVKITKSEILVPYFNDLRKEEEVSHRQPKETSLKKSKKKKPKIELSLGFEDEADGQDLGPVKKIRMKSAHELLNDKKLSKEKANLDEPLKSDEQIAKRKSYNEANEEQNDNEPNKDDMRSQELQKLQAEIESKKLSLETGHDEKKSLEVDNKPQKSNSKKNGKPDKQLRELETLKILNSFKTKIGSTSHASKPNRLEEDKTTTERDMGHDDDFDNLDDSDTDIDLYSHSLRFEDNEKNKDIANEDLLITIDDSKERELKKRRNDNFYRIQESSSVLQKKARR